MISKGETYNHLRGTGKEMRSKVQRSSGNEKLLISEPEMGKKKNRSGKSVHKQGCD